MSLNSLIGLAICLDHLICNHQVHNGAVSPMSEADCMEPMQLTAFTIAPILKHPDPSKIFIVEVDALETGVGVVLSQNFGDKPKLHLVAFYSKKLSTSEQNYDIGN